MSKTQSCPICNAVAEVSILGLYDDRYGYPGTFDLYKCSKCKHKFLWAPFSEQQLVDLYSKYYPRSSFRVEDYKPLSYSATFQTWFNGEKRAFALVPERVRILDVGCGFGEALGYHKNRGCDAYGIEADQNILRIAEVQGFKVKVGIFTSDLYDKNFFNFVTLDQVLEHSTDPVDLMRGVQSVLKSGGKMVITIPNGSGWGARYFGKKWIHWHTPYHLQFFSRKSLNIAAEKAGLKVTAWETHTSSEWLLYQKISNLVFPEKAGEPSYFWSPRRSWESTPGEVKQKRDSIQKWHRRKLNHVITRFFDCMGLGDNLLISLEKM